MIQNSKRVKSTETELHDKLVAVNRVTKVTKGGRAFGFAAIVVVGDEKGVVGHGLGKAKEVTDAVTKAIDDAKKNLVRVPIHKGTVPHEQDGKFGGARVFLKPAAQELELSQVVQCVQYLKVLVLLTFLQNQKALPTHIML